MTFAVPGALWGLLAIPLLVMLYLLRVRRREHAVSSILLWQRSAPTLAAYRPSRRIERSLLLLLQIIMATALVTALARPAVVGRGVGGEDVMLVLDASLSMRARDVAPARFDRARAEALDVVVRLRQGQRAGLILAASRPLLLSPVTEDRARLRAALDAAQPWDTAGDVAGATTLAASQLPGSGGRIIVWTDAARGPLPPLPRAAYRILGTSDDNVGITALRVLRDPQGSEALVRVENFGSTDRQVPLEVRRDGVPVHRETLALPAGTSRAVTFPVAGAGVLQAQINVRDALPEDDVATAVLDPAPLPSVLLVSPGNPSLERILRLLPVGRAVETRAVDPAAWGAFGVVILDRVETGPLPPGNYVLIGTVPPNLPVGAAGTVTRPQIATWDRTDPILRFVDLDGVRVDRAFEIAPQGGRVLVAGGTPLLWAYDGRGVRALLFGFSLEDSDLPQHVAFPILMANSLAWLGSASSDTRAGDAIQVPASGAAEAVLAMPDGHRARVRATDGMFVLPAFTRTGLYRLTTPAGDRQIAVGIGSPRAGVIKPGPAPAAAASGVADPAGLAPGDLRTQIALWPWLLLGAVAAAVGEWMLATRALRSVAPHAGRSRRGDVAR